MSIQSKLNSLKPYVQAMRFVEDYPIIDAIFKKEWKVPSGSTIKVVEDVKAENPKFVSYNFFSENKAVGFDELLEYVSEVINLNIEREKKQELFKIKNQELKNLFLSKENSYNDLLNLDFIIKSKKEESDENLDFNDEDLEEEKLTEETNKIIEPVEKEKVIPVEVKGDKKPLVVETEEEPPLAETDQPKYEL